jgi:DNA-binding response OmpR family regulator
MSEVAPLILLAEDDRNIRETTYDLLTLAGFRVRTATTGREAGAVLERERMDLVITDLVMPEGDGAWLIERIRGDKLLRGLPVILLTAHADTTKNAVHARELANAYLTKPFDPDLLIEVAKRWSRCSPLERELLSPS